MEKKQKLITLFILDILAAFDIVWTVYLGNFDDWTLYNLSVVGYWRGHEWELRIWGWVTAVLFVSFLLFVMKVQSIQNRVAVILAVFAGIILSIGVVIPYEPIPNETSFISNMHIACSLIAPLCLVACMCMIIVTCIRRRIKYMKVMAALVVILLAIAAYIFVKYTIITTVLELYTVSAITVFLNLMVFCSGEKNE